MTFTKKNGQYLTLLISLLLLPWGCEKDSGLSEPRNQTVAEKPDLHAEHDPNLQLKTGYAGSVSCRKCHERFYKLWAPSFHGLAMQPYTAELGQTKLRPHENEIVIGDYRYQAVFDDQGGWVQGAGPDGMQKYEIEHVMGGKNVIYFLTLMDRGFLQVLPLGYDMNRKSWFDVAGSGVRHFPGQGQDAPLHWQDRPYTFNTACYSCHVSQLSTNYDPATDAYNTVWREPGINCEACHGPCEEHIRVCAEAPKGTIPDDLKIISMKNFSVAQTNSACAPCHAQMIPLTTSFKPGDRYFDHFDLVTMEDQDFYPDGRDLGENYTFTLWRMSPCVKSGQLDCLHCHTSSGRYRFTGQAANQACLPCHQERVENAGTHTHHPAGTEEGNRCIDCHMPMTEFARMRRSDHSMLPPAPAATLAYHSPNACNICHRDKNTQWADKWVRQWHTKDYQQSVLVRAKLIDMARKRDWSRLDDMLAYIESNNREEIIANSLIRMLVSCDNSRKWPTLLKALRDSSPLVRASAAQALTGYYTLEGVTALLAATRDDVRLVRIRAAGALAGLPPGNLTEPMLQGLNQASEELESMLRIRPDSYTSYYGQGNLYTDRKQYEKAVASFKKALKLQPGTVPVLTNLALVYNSQGKKGEAETCLRKALKLAPENAAVNLNIGLLMAEQEKKKEAVGFLRACLKSDPNMAVAAYNLGILLAGESPAEAVRWSGKATELRPDNPKYAYTHAFYLKENREISSAVKQLQHMIKKWPGFAGAPVLLGEIYLSQGKTEKARKTYEEGLTREALSREDKYLLKKKLNALAAYE